VGELHCCGQRPQESLALRRAELTRHLRRRHALGEIRAKVQGEAPPEKKVARRKLQ
jgi:hypothetical protein